MSTRHLQRLAKEGGTPPRQLVLAARLVKLLRYVWNPEGVIAWFHRERAELDGHAPSAALPGEINLTLFAFAAAAQPPKCSVQFTCGPAAQNAGGAPRSPCAGHGL
jgi:hypothetical protein